MPTLSQPTIKVTKEGNVGLVRFAGELTSAAGPRLVEICRELSEFTECDFITLDLSELGYTNTAGIALLMAMIACVGSGRTLNTIGLSAHHQRLFRAVGLSSQLGVV